MSTRPMRAAVTMVVTSSTTRRSAPRHYSNLAWSAGHGGRLRAEARLPQWYTVGHLHAFGSTEGRLRVRAGPAARRASDPPFHHKRLVGGRWRRIAAITSTRAIYNKKNN
eukprot:scaffold11372_cov107-Isochrysis_galbana.AAC.2